MLALEAKEILNYKTPTTCLEAIAIRHKLEVKAECMFYGVEYNIDVENRFKELEGEIRTVCKWFHSKVSEKSLLNAKMSIVTEIMRIFKEHGQFDEEQKCLVYFRGLNREWYFLRHPFLRFLLFPRLFRWYVETLVSSLRKFILAILLWPLAGGIISQLAGADFGTVDRVINGNSVVGERVINGISDHLMNSTITFYGLQPGGFPMDPAAKVITAVLILGGFLHLGIFISHLYTLITRGK